MTDLAISHYQQAIKENPNLEQAYSSLSLQLSNRGTLEEAENLARRAIQLNPDDPAAHANLGVALAKSAKTEQAIDEFQRSVMLDPAYALAYAGLADAFLARTNLLSTEESAESFKKAEKYAQKSLELG